MAPPLRRLCRSCSHYGMAASASVSSVSTRPRRRAPVRSGAHAGREGGNAPVLPLLYRERQVQCKGMNCRHHRRAIASRQQQHSQPHAPVLPPIRQPPPCGLVGTWERVFDDAADTWPAASRALLPAIVHDMLSGEQRKFTRVVADRDGGTLLGMLRLRH
jgi:hypothetical protein